MLQRGGWWCGVCGGRDEGVRGVGVGVRSRGWLEVDGVVQQPVEAVVGGHRPLTALTARWGTNPTITANYDIMTLRSDKGADGGKSGEVRSVKRELPGASD